MSEEILNYFIIFLYLIPVFAFISWRTRVHQRRERAHITELEENTKAGLMEPASLHPKINSALCIGCNTCAPACPEGNVLGIIGSRVELINPTHCIGHGACAIACPVGAITLVFGTEKRGVDIPTLNPNFETNIPGIFIAGELGGMGLIRNAVTQGNQAIENIAKKPGVGKGGKLLDVVIVGAGPAGFSATLGAHKLNLKYVTLEQETFGGTVSHYPRGKIVMTQPAILPIVGKVNFRETTKEALMEFWEKTRKQTDIKINTQEEMTAVEPIDGGFVVKTAKKEYRTKTVLLTIGRRGSPRKLDVPGEDQTKVVYRLIDPEQYRGQHVLVVGGGDSALEAALSIADEPGSTVTLSYRSGSFNRAKPKNRDKVDAAQQAKKLTVLYSSNVKNIKAKTVELEHEGKMLEIPNDIVIISAGGVIPMPMLKKMGIEVVTKHGTT
ncbi:MAG: NAD(P)-binding domain-containing protein [Gammaproteobacteria bacterium]|nr:NAD(P)-binding domain-containing protein [Gammaproteobacteria bacterium]